MSDTGDTDMGGSQDKDDFRGLSSDETKDASPEATSPKRKKFKTSRRDAPDKDRSDDTADDKSPRIQGNRQDRLDQQGRKQVTSWKTSGLAGRESG